MATTSWLRRPYSTIHVEDSHCPLFHVLDDVQCLELVADSEAHDDCASGGQSTRRGYGCQLKRQG